MPDEKTATEIPTSELTDEQVQAIYATMSEHGYDNEDEFADAIEHGHVDLKPAEEPEREAEATTDEGQEQGTEQDTQTTESTDTAQQTADKPVEQPAATPEKPKELEQAESRYKTLQGMFDANNRELQALRQRFAQVEPFVGHLENPVFRQHVLSYFNAPQQQGTPSGGEDEYLTRADMNRMLAEQEQRRAFADQQMKRQNMQQMFVQASQRNRQKVISTGTTPEDVEKNFEGFKQRFFTGDIYELAHKAMTYDEAVAAAEKRGREAAIREMQTTREKTPPRAATVTTKAEPSKGKNTGRSFDEMSASELKAYAGNVDPDSPEGERFGRWLMRNGG